MTNLSGIYLVNFNFAESHFADSQFADSQFAESILPNPSLPNMVKKRYFDILD